MAENSHSGAGTTIARPNLPPLPPALNGLPGTQQAAAPVAAAAVPAAAAVADSGVLAANIARPNLPTLPPALKAHSTAAAMFPNLQKSEPLAPTTTTTTPAATAADAEVDTSTKSDKEEKKAAKAEKAEKAAKAKKAEEAAKAKTVEEAAKAKTAAKVKTEKPTKLKGAGTSNFKPVLAAVVALAVIGAAVFFILPFLNQGPTISQLQTGDCVENFFETSDDGSFIEIFSVGKVECAEPHAYEVFTTDATLFPDEDYPGIEASFAVGQDFCLTEYESFIGGGQENLTSWDVWTFVPPESSWGEERVVHCLVGDFNETELATGTLRGAAA